MRKLDTLGMTGVVMLVGGATTFLSDDHLLPLWMAWIVGPLLWYLGFGVMIAWLCGRFFIAPAGEEPEEAAVETSVRHSQPSNFLEHDWEPAAPVRWQTGPILTTVMLLLLVSMLAIRGTPRRHQQGPQQNAGIRQQAQQGADRRSATLHPYVSQKIGARN
jgi:hypothetical protein